MANEELKATRAQESYDATKIAVALQDLQKSFNPDQVALAVAQILQGDGTATVPNTEPISDPPPPSAPDDSSAQGE
ncbi:MAG: hypothetical protein NTW68_00315 [candidate division NC10 bacterium]|nr:hypothetical protein [candidate division NC10 bacterium]